MEHPRMKRLPADPERCFQALIRPGAVAVDRDRECENLYFRHGRSAWVVSFAQRTIERGGNRHSKSRRPALGRDVVTECGLRRCARGAEVRGEEESLDPGLRRDDNEFECRWARECSMQRGPSYIHVGRLGNVPDQPSTSYIHVDTVLVVKHFVGQVEGCMVFHT